jgi:hypothetical protein
MAAAERGGREGAPKRRGQTAAMAIGARTCVEVADDGVGAELGLPPHRAAGDAAGTGEAEELP